MGIAERKRRNNKCIEETRVRLTAGMGICMEFFVPMAHDYIDSEKALFQIADSIGVKYPDRHERIYKVVFWGNTTNMTAEVAKPIIVAENNNKLVLAIFAGLQYRVMLQDEDTLQRAPVDIPARNIKKVIFFDEP